MFFEETELLFPQPGSMYTLYGQAYIYTHVIIINNNNNFNSA